MTCRLYLVAPEDLGSAARPTSSFADLLSDLLSQVEADCLLLRRGASNAAEMRETATALAPIVQNLGVAVLLEDDAGLAKETGCDGVHLNNPKAYRGARKLLGDDAIVGVDCGLSRHLALEAAERGADYVAFRRPPDDTGAEEDAVDETAPTLEAVLGWWQAMIETPCVAMDAKNPEECLNLAESGADFVAPVPEVWKDSADPAETIKAVASKLA